MIPSADEARSAARRGSWRRLRAVLRPEDALFLVALVPSTIVTIWANVSLSNAGVDSRRIRGGLLRLGVAAILAVAVPLLVRALRRRRRALQAAEFLYTILPFLLCIAVYTNLHDTIRFINPHDIDPYLAGAEAWVFGGQPVVWAQQFITPFRTDLFSLLYTSFVLIAPSVVLILWFSGRRAEAREVLLATIVCFYSGYVLYVIFPATPPRLYLAAHGAFTKALHGGALTNMQQAMIEMMPRHASRAAFPSLHSAVSCLSLYYAWRYCRWFFPILLVLVIGLLTSTIYLRHHYVLDLAAGAMLVPWAVWASGRLDAWWRRD